MTVGLLGLLGRCQVVVVNGLVSGTDVLGLGVTIGLGREIRGNTVHRLNTMNDISSLIVGSGILVRRAASGIDYGSLVDCALVV